MPSTNSSSSHAFIEGSQITNPILIVNEIVEYHSNKKKGSTGFSRRCFHALKDFLTKIIEGKRWKEPPKNGQLT